MMTTKKNNIKGITFRIFFSSWQMMNPPEVEELELLKGLFTLKLIFDMF